LIEVNDYPKFEYSRPEKIMDTINIQYLLCSVNTGKIGQVNLNLAVWLKFLFLQNHPENKRV